MPINTAPDGTVTGEIDIQDDDLTSDVHEIEITGDQGTVVKGFYINDPSLSMEDMRKAKITAGADLFAPIAQTFVYGEGRDIARVSLDIDASDPGDGDVIIQIRGVTNGIVNQKVLAESRVEKANIQASGTFTDFDLNPLVPIVAGREYAIVISTKNVNYTVATAELGKADINGNLVAGQPNAGVLLVSSNARSWSALQTQDLKFKIAAARYTANTKTINLGNVSANDVTDVLVLANTDISDKDTRVTFTVTDPDSNVLQVDKDEPVILDSRKNGIFNVQANLEGNEKKSPILFPNTKLILGEINLTGTYQGQKFQTGAPTFNYRLNVEVKATGSATHQPAIEDTSAGNFTDFALINSVQLNDGFVLQTWEVSGITAISGLSSIRITPTATDTGRVFLRDLRSFAIA